MGYLKPNVSPPKINLLLSNSLLQNLRLVVRGAIKQLVEPENMPPVHHEGEEEDTSKAER